MKPQSLYAQLELIPEDHAASADRIALRQPRKSMSFHFKQLRAAVFTFLISSEPRIEERVDQHGNRFFNVYDPITRRSSNFGSEQELRSWIDQRYYQ